jgi:dipeptide/tripeptide permease
MLRRFFSLFYFSINAGSVISTLLTPVLRSELLEVVLVLLMLLPLQAMFTVLTSVIALHWRLESLLS